jgi:hypothetical protein
MAAAEPVSQMDGNALTCLQSRIIRHVAENLVAQAFQPVKKPIYE